jgi:ribonuclease P protein component
MDSAAAWPPLAAARCSTPGATAAGSGSAPDPGPSASAVERLRKRADFLGVAAGPRTPTEAFVLQARERSDTGPPRVGFTVSRKVGTAVERNRARRRLREVVRLCDAERFKAGNDYVLIGRRPALELPFGRLVDDFARALARVNQQRRVPRRPADRRGGGRGEVSPAGSQTSS